MIAPTRSCPPGPPSGPSQLSYCEIKSTKSNDGGPPKGVIDVYQPDRRTWPHSSGFDQTRAHRGPGRLRIRDHQKSGTTACGIGRADAPGKKELGLSAQIISVIGPSGALASCARRSIGTWRTAASY